jgi:hypothetical protein
VFRRAQLYYHRRVKPSLQAPDSVQARRSRRTAAIVIAAAALVAVVSLLVILRGGRGARGPAHLPGRSSFWHVPLPGETPNAAAAAPVAATIVPDGGITDPRSQLAILVEDATGGAIPGAAIVVDDKRIGATDGTGWLRVAAGTVAHTGTVEVSAAGYAEGSAAYASPGEVRVQLLPGGQISGVVVEAGSGRGVPDLEVRANAVVTTSDAQGRFDLRGVYAGMVRLQARGPHHIGALPTPIALGIGKVVADVRLEVQPAYAIRGRVLAEGQPIHGGTAPASIAGAGTTSKVDDEGRYQLNGVHPGRHAISVQGRGPSEFLSLSESVPVEVKETDLVQDIEIGPRFGLAVAVVDPRGNPLADRTVEATQSIGDHLVSNRCTTKVDGRCSYFGFRRGEVTLQPAHSTSAARKIALPGPSEVQLVVDADGLIAGRLVGADGRPPRPRGVMITGRVIGHDSVLSAPDGTFSLPHLPADHYELVVTDAELVWGKPPAEAGLSVPLGAGQQKSDLVITLATEDGQISGQVVDASDRPVGDALVGVNVYRPNSETQGFYGAFERAVTGPDGRFVFSRLLPTQRFSITAQDPGGRLGDLPNVAPGADVTVRLIARAQLEVRLRDESNHLSFTLIEVLDGDKVVATRPRFEEDDSVYFDGLLPGPRLVRVLYRPLKVEAAVNLEPGKATTVTLTVP